MHACFRVDEILRLIASELVGSRLRRTAVALACCCRAFEDPVLDALWETKYNLMYLLRTFPRDIWCPTGHMSLIRPPTAREWARLWEYAQRVKVFMPFDPLPLQVLSVVQFHTPGRRLLPNLKALQLFSVPVTSDSISFIPLFLSPRLTTIELRFSKLSACNVMAASMIANLPITCPDLQRIHLEGLPRDPVTIGATSQLLTATRGIFRSFHVDSPLTQEAAEILFKSPHLCEVYTVIDGPTSLPMIELPNLTRMNITFYQYYGWLRGFHGASLGKLVSLTFRCESEPIGFLEAFERATVTTSIPTTLSTFRFCTTRPWRPNHRSLLRFTHLTELDIEFPCTSSCSSTIDDDAITELAQALHALELLRLGGRPCEAPTGITAKGFSALAYYCPNLYHLRIHFQVATLDPPLLTSSGKLREGCSLTFLDVGHIRVPEASTLMVAVTLLRIFPNLEFIHYSDIGWEKVANAISGSKKLADCSRPGAVVEPDE